MLSLTNGSATVLGASNVGGNLTVTDTVGNLTQTGGADGRRHVVVHDLGRERDDHADQHRQPADRRGGADHQWRRAAMPA